MVIIISFPEVPWHVTDGLLIHRPSSSTDPPPHFPESGGVSERCFCLLPFPAGVETPARRDLKLLLRDRSFRCAPRLRGPLDCARSLSIVLANPPPELSNSAARAPRPALIAQTASAPFRHGVHLCCCALRAGWRAMKRAPRNWPEKHGSPENAASAALDIITEAGRRLLRRGRYGRDPVWFWLFCWLKLCVAAVLMLHCQFGSSALVLGRKQVHAYFCWSALAGSCKVWGNL